MSYITTVSGKHFDPVEPDEELLDINDIAHSLSQICRGNGHTRFFYSVAQHSICCAREAMARNLSDRIVLGCLLHDGSEAYLSDVTRPVKKDLQYYLEVEDRLQHLIWKHFLGSPVSDEEEKTIMGIDDDMLSMEFHQVMAEDYDERYHLLVRQFVCRQQDMKEVEKEFTDIFRSMNNK